MRTIRELCAAVILMAPLFSMFWLAVLGGAGVDIELFGAGGIAELVFQVYSGHNDD